MTTLRTCVAFCSHRQDRHGKLFQAQPLEMGNILRKGSAELMEAFKCLAMLPL
jgi:hypothetical protein